MNNINKGQILRHLTCLIKDNNKSAKTEKYDWDKIYYAGRRDSLVLLKRAIKIGGFEEKSKEAKKKDE